jgi:putative glutathione S-transferase
LRGRRRYLAGGRFTEADVRLFATLVRFDAVYVASV